MKIGIITLPLHTNYGGILQAYALQTVLERMGHQVDILEEPLVYKHASLNRYIRRILKKCVGKRSIINYEGFMRKWQPRVAANINQFINTYIHRRIVNFDSLSDGEYDAFVVGSDQIWRKQSTGRFNPIYFADNPIFAKKHIAYAASMGKLHSEDGDLQFLHDKLQKFDAISVREASLCQLVNRAGFASKVVLDPTLLLTKEDWNNTIPTRRLVKEDYLLFYNMQKNAFNYDAVERFANSKGLKVVEIRPDSSHKKNVFSLIGPEEFLSLVRYSSFVITSSFHGLAFSVIYEKQFFCSYSEKADRAKTLLSSLQLGDRLIMPGLDILPTCENIDYKHSKLLFEHMKEESINFLLEAFQN